LCIAVVDEFRDPTRAPDGHCHLGDRGEIGNAGVNDTGRPLPMARDVPAHIGADRNTRRILTVKYALERNADSRAPLSTTASSLPSRATTSGQSIRAVMRLRR
jgi:hypothetical protein